MRGQLLRTPTSHSDTYFENGSWRTAKSASTVVFVLSWSYSATATQNSDWEAARIMRCSTCSTSIAFLIFLISPKSYHWRSLILAESATIGSAMRTELCWYVNSQHILVKTSFKHYARARYSARKAMVRCPLSESVNPPSERSQTAVTPQWERKSNISRGGRCGSRVARLGDRGNGRR
jgi:hypothetical protein